MLNYARKRETKNIFFFHTYFNMLIASSIGVVENIYIFVRIIEVFKADIYFKVG
jgi:hypothetical protein